MKKLNRFYQENSKTVNAIDENKQSSCKGGRFSSPSVLDSVTPAKGIRRKLSKLSEVKNFTSFSEIRAFMLTGK